PGQGQAGEQEAQEGHAQRIGVLGGVVADMEGHRPDRGGAQHAQVGAGQAPARRRGGQRAHAAFPPAARVMSWATTTGTTWPCAASMAAMMLARLRRRSGSPMGSWPSKYAFCTSITGRARRMECMADLAGGKQGSHLPVRPGSPTLAFA